MKLGPFNLTRTAPRGKRPAQPSAIPGSNIYHGPSQWGDIPLPFASEATVRGLPAANRALNLVSNGVASMAPLDLWTPDGYIDDNPPVLLTRPNSVWTSFAFWHMAVATLLMHGNFLGLWADFDGDGYPQQVVPVPPGFWLAYYDGDGYLTYSINGETYEREEVCHVAINASPIQPMGVGVVTQFRRNIGKALDEQNFAADTFRSGSVPAGLIHLDLPEVDDTQARTVTDQFVANHAGGRAPAVLPSTMTYEALSWSPLDMQFLEEQTHTIGEIAHMFNMDPTDLGASFGGGSALTYSNIEQRVQARIGDTYLPIGIRFEEEFSDQVTSSYSAKFAPDRLLRTDTRTRAEVDQLEIANETLTVDEARKTRGKRPLPKTPCPTCDAPVSSTAMPTHMAAHAAAHGVATNGAASGDVLADVAGVPKPEAVPDDPNISITPVKVKV